MSEFVDCLHDVFALFDSIGAKRMFGGYGIYRDGLMFAVAVDDVLYLKTTDRLRRDFDSRSLPP